MYINGARNIVRSLFKDGGLFQSSCPSGVVPDSDVLGAGGDQVTPELQL